MVKELYVAARRFAISSSGIIDDLEYFVVTYDKESRDPRSEQLLWSAIAFVVRAIRGWYGVVECSQKGFSRLAKNTDRAFVAAFAATNLPKDYADKVSQTVLEAMRDMQILLEAVEAARKAETAPVEIAYTIQTSIRYSQTFAASLKSDAALCSKGN